MNETMMSVGFFVAGLLIGWLLGGAVATDKFRRRP